MKKVKASIFTITASLIMAIFFTGVVLALSIPDKPTNSSIVDQTGTLTEDQKSTLEKHIADERRVSSNQIAIVIIPSLEGKALEDYSLSIARKWGIGTKKDNGVLLFVALHDRKLRIEVGYGLEGGLTDVQAIRIVRNDITPEFKKGKYYDGIYAGVIAIIDAIHGEYVSASSTSSASNNASGAWLAILTMIVVSSAGLFNIIIPRLAKTKRWWAGGVLGGIIGLTFLTFTQILAVNIILFILSILIGLAIDKAVSKNYASRKKSKKKPSWWAGGGHDGWGGSGGGSGGGGGDFGGGDFGGGGASGSW